MPKINDNPEVEQLLTAAIGHHINYLSLEEGCNLPDFIIADFLVHCFKALELSMSNDTPIGQRCYARTQLPNGEEITLFILRNDPKEDIEAANRIFEKRTE